MGWRGRRLEGLMLETALFQLFPCRTRASESSPKFAGSTQMPGHPEAKGHTKVTPKRHPKLLPRASQFCAHQRWHPPPIGRVIFNAARGFQRTKEHYMNIFVMSRRMRTGIGAIPKAVCDKFSVVKSSSKTPPKLSLVHNSDHHVTLL